jgi:hypothetical protein
MFVKLDQGDSEILLVFVDDKQRTELRSCTRPYPSVIFLLREVKLVEMPDFTG